MGKLFLFCNYILDRQWEVYRSLARRKEAFCYGARCNSAVILRHNKKLLSALPKTDRPPTADPKCNCRIKTACPLDGKCKQKCIIYKAEISSNNTTKLYYGSCSTDFKARFSNHKHSFTHRNKKTQPSYQKKFGEQRIMALSRL